MSQIRILVAGIGNIFLGDDAFGSETARRLSLRPLPAGVRVQDFGIRGYDLAYALMEAWDAAILIDATPRGERPGSLYTLEIDCGQLERQAEPDGMDAHGMNPMRVLELVRASGCTPHRLLLVGCEPSLMDQPEEGALGLSPPVAAAVEEAVTVIERLVNKIAGEHHEGVLAASG